jgi:hypothetical protein
MPNNKTQLKLKIDPDIAIAFKARCVSECVSMSSVVQGWMQSRHPRRNLSANDRTHLTRPQRRKAVTEIIAMLNSVLENEEQYRDSIPEQFEQRHEAADLSCDKLAEAIVSLEEAF